MKMLAHRCRVRKRDLDRESPAAGATQLAESITCAPAGQYAGASRSVEEAFRAPCACEFDNPLTWRFDETDSMVMCEEVKVPWERVFVSWTPILAREIYIKDAGHCYGNHQCDVPSTRR